MERGEAPLRAEAHTQEDRSKKQLLQNGKERTTGSNGGRVLGPRAGNIAAGVAVALLGLKLGSMVLRRLRGGKQRRAATPSTAAAPAERSAQVQAVVPGAHVGSEDSWNVVDAPAPAVPSSYKAIVSTTLSCTPQELYSILISAQGADLFLQQHREQGRHHSLVVTGWKRAAAAGAGAAAAAGGGPATPAEDGSLLGSSSVFEYVVGQPGSGGFTRLLTFVNPRKPPQPRDTRCVQRQQYCVYRGGVLLFATAMNMLDIPFKECFTVNTLWRAEPGPAEGTTQLGVHLRVQFLRSARGMGGIISATTFGDTTAFYRAYFAAVERAVTAARQAAGAPLPAPLPLALLGRGAAGAERGAAPATARSAGRLSLSTPFATLAASPAASIAGSGLAAPASYGPVQGQQQQQQLRHSLPVWKQLRALLVFAVLTFTLVHQLRLGQELAELRGRGTGSGGTGEGAAGGAGGGGWGRGDADAGSGITAAAAAVADAGHEAAAQAGGLLAAVLGPLVGAAGSAPLVMQAVFERLVRGAGGAGAGAAVQPS